MIIIVSITDWPLLFVSFLLYISFVGVNCLVSGSKEAQSTGVIASSPGLAGITVDKSVEFSYEELAQATDNFSMANKIGEGGFGAVFYANLRGEVCM